MGSHSRRKIDLTGQRYGRLTVLCPAERIGRHTAWVCRCECGKMTVVRTDHLRDGHVSSCGCLPRKGNPRSFGLGLTYIDGTCLEMLRAKTIRSNNRSGVTGVNWDKEKQRWRASICFKGRRYLLGRYTRFEDAVESRKKAEQEMHDAFVRENDRTAV